jgi:hypothetical protein
MNIERRSKLWSGPPIVPADPATEREPLIAANQAFAAALKKALQNGAETSAGVLATVSPKRRERTAIALLRADTEPRMPLAKARLIQ